MNHVASPGKIPLTRLGMLVRDAQTFAVRLAAFRSLLLETARARGIDLRVEALSSGVPDPGIPACAEPAVQL